MRTKCLVCAKTIRALMDLNVVLTGTHWIESFVSARQHTIDSRIHTRQCLRYCDYLHRWHTAALLVRPTACRHTNLRHPQRPCLHISGDKQATLPALSVPFALSSTNFKCEINTRDFVEYQMRRECGSVYSIIWVNFRSADRIM